MDCNTSRWQGKDHARHVFRRGRGIRRQRRSKQYRQKWICRYRGGCQEVVFVYARRIDPPGGYLVKLSISHLPSMGIMRLCNREVAGYFRLSILVAKTCIYPLCTVGIRYLCRLSGLILKDISLFPFFSPCPAWPGGWWLFAKNQHILMMLADFL